LPNPLTYTNADFTTAPPVNLEDADRLKQEFEAANFSSTPVTFQDISINDLGGANNVIVTFSGVPNATDETTSDSVISTHTAPGVHASNQTGLHRRVTTVNATPVVLVSYLTKSDNSTIHLTVHVTARDLTTGDVGTWTRVVSAARSNSSVVTINVTDDIHTHEDDATWDVTASVTSQTINILATGDATNNTSFSATGTVLESV